MVESKCLYAGNCGGCSAQHIDYNKQLENKKNILSNLLNFKKVEVFYDKEYGYRNRMDFLFYAGGVGLRKKRQWRKIVDIERCEIVNERINELLKEVKMYFKNVDAFDVIKKTGTFRYVVIRASNMSSSMSFVLNEDSPELSEAVEKIKEFAEKSSAESIVITYVSSSIDSGISNEFFVVKGSEMMKEKYLGKEFLFSIQGFFQNNSEMAEKMQEYCNLLLKKYDQLNKTRGATLLDLYGGVGTFGIINSDLFKEVITVENDKNCGIAANLNIKRNNLLNVKAKTMDAKNLKKLGLKGQVFVINDPPRSGMDPKIIDQLNLLRPEVIIYISCNVQQLGKDSLKFKNYKIRSVAMFDLFPQTPHIEAIVELVKI
ncbi:MAG: 23S rRNA (uracil(1939)-C(5))-methyltransferase RlmD [Candidatus Pacearchaeota archaeon]|nr:23S rRNA (uracil(1939)-C(5))-methyltransferase RlmD [Candidatus Pacearchaeota archaeon]